MLTIPKVSNILPPCLSLTASSSPFAILHQQPHSSSARASSHRASAVKALSASEAYYTHQFTYEPHRLPQIQRPHPQTASNPEQHSRHGAQHWHRHPRHLPPDPLPVRRLRLPLDLQ